MRLPLWVRLWIAFGLGGVNLASFFLTWTPTGYWAAWSTAFILAVNGSIVLVQRGWGKLLALPHLLVWIPLLAFAAQRLGAPDVSPAEFRYALVLLVVDGISLAFDVVDAWRWFSGDRAVA